MCLYIKPVPTETTVYKVYRLVKKFKTVVHVSPPYQGGLLSLRKKAEITSTRVDTHLTAEEAQQGTVNFGLHVFATQEAAVHNAVGRGGKFVIVSCVGKHTDFIAKGRFPKNGAVSAVYRRLFVKDFVKEVEAGVVSDFSF